MTWFRIECGAADDELFDRLAEALGISTGEAFYHYFAFTGRLADQDTSGNMRDLLDRTVEKWAKWTGTPGGFARVLRGLCEEVSTGELRGFRSRNEKLLQKQAKDRRKRKNLSQESDEIANPPQTREGFSGEPPANPRANDNGNKNNTTASPRAGVSSPLESGLLDRMVAPEDRTAVIAFLDRAPPPTGSREAWIARLLAYLQGLDFPAGVLPSPAQLATACRDYAGGFAPVHVRAFVLRAVQGLSPPKNSTHPKRDTTQEQVDAGRRWAARGG